MRPYNADTERLPRGVVPGAINGARSARIEAFKRAKEPDRLRRQPRREASFSLEVLGARLYPAARPRLAFPIIPTPLIQSPSLRRRAAMLAIPAAKAPRMAAPAPLVIVPTPVLGSIVTTTTLPGGVLLGAGAGTGTGTGTDTGLPGTGLKGGGSRQIGTGPAIVSRRRWRCRHYHPS